jgi:uncharacterized protein (DUF1778 family)
MFMREHRIEFRSNEKERKQFEEAAFFLGMNLSSFARKTMLEKSEEVLKKNTFIVLSNEDRDTFLHALENPPKPNKRLKKALEAHRRLSKKIKC